MNPFTYFNLTKKKGKLPEGTKEQGGYETFKFKAGYNNIDKKFYISLTSRKTFHTARLNLESEEYNHILNKLAVIWEDNTNPKSDGREHEDHNWLK